MVERTTAELKQNLDMKSNNLLIHERLAGIALAAATGVAGALGVSPAITDMDGGEFALIAARGGIAHPPGYPLYSAILRAWHELIARPFTITPEITSPPALASLSVLMSVATAWLAWRAFLKISPNKTPELVWRAAFASGLVMLTFPVLRASTAIEPFAANNLMAAALMLVAARELAGKEKTSRTGQDWWTWNGFATGLLFGLAFCNHHSLAFAAPMALAMFPLSRKQLRGLAVSILAGFTAGCLPMVWFAVAATNTSGLMWGDWSNFGNQLVRHLFRLGYGTFRLTAEASGTFWSGPWFMIQVLGRSLGGLAVLAAAGVVIASQQGFGLGKPGKKFAQITFASFLGSGLLMPVLFRLNPAPDTAEVMARFAALPVIFLIPLVAFGVAPLTSRALRSSLRNQTINTKRFLALAVVTGVAVMIAGALNAPKLPVRSWGGRSGETLTNLHLDKAAEAATLPSATRPPVIVTNSDLDYFGNLYKAARQIPGRPPAVVIQSGLWPTRWHREAVLRDLAKTGFNLPATWVTSGQEFMEIEDSFRLLAAILTHLSKATPVNLATGNFPGMAPLLASSYPLGPFVRILAAEEAIPPHEEVLRLNEDLSKAIRAWTASHRPATAWENHALEGWRRSWTALGLPAVPETP
ncbi:MAG: hypothetical protein RIQ81_876 [Pseudomonadota bacterium]